MYCKVVLSIDENQGGIGERGTFAFSPMFLNHLDSSFTGSHYFCVSCIIPSLSAHTQPVTAFSLRWKTTVEEKDASLSEDIRKKTQRS